MTVDLRAALGGEFVAEIGVQQSQGPLAVRISNVYGSHDYFADALFSVQTRIARTSKGGAASSLFLQVFVVKTTEFDYKEKVIDLLTRVTTVSVRTVTIVGEMRKAAR
jgi:hypothetical protein